MVLSHSCGFFEAALICLLRSQLGMPAEDRHTLRPAEPFLLEPPLTWVSSVLFSCVVFCGVVLLSWVSCRSSCGKSLAPFCL